MPAPEPASRSKLRSRVKARDDLKKETVGIFADYQNKIYELMKSGCGTVFIFFLGFLGLAILYMAVRQYLIKGESLHDQGIPVTAVVVDTLIVHEEVAGNYRAPFSTPVISFTLEGKNVTDTATGWIYRLDTENITSQSNSLLLPGDSLELLVNPNYPDVYIKAGETDDTNIVGFAIWGTIGLALFIPFLLRLKKLFPKDAEQRQWGG